MSCSTPLLSQDTVQDDICWNVFNSSENTHENAQYYNMAYIGKQGWKCEKAQ